MHISELSLFHYYERAAGPFRSLTSLPEAEAQAVQASLTGFAAQRSADYLSRRRTLEAEMRILFLQAGGQPQRTAPHYLVIGECPFLASWYHDPAVFRLPLNSVDPSVISFTYGDFFATFSDRVQDRREYRRRIYTLPEILHLIEQYGLPQEIWPQEPHFFGQPAYVEAQLWSDDPLRALPATLQS